MYKKEKGVSKLLDAFALIVFSYLLFCGILGLLGRFDILEIVFYPFANFLVALRETRTCNSSIIYSSIFSVIWVAATHIGLHLANKIAPKEIGGISVRGALSNYNFIIRYIMVPIIIVAIFYFSGVIELCF